MKTTFKNYTFTYSIGANGFKTSITVNSNNSENALRSAREEISQAYGSDIYKDLIIHQ